MKYSIEKSVRSNYRIALEIGEDELNGFRTLGAKNLRSEQKDKSVEINSAYIEMVTLEEAIHAGTKKVLEENSRIKFIGNIYDLNKEEKESITYISFYLDVYPELEVLNDKWRSYDQKELDAEPTHEEVNDTLYNLRRQYADYKDIDEIETESIIKVKRSFTDFDHNVISAQELVIESIDWYKNMTDFDCKRKGEINKKGFYKINIPEILKDHKLNLDSGFIIVEIVDIKKVVLPEFTKENIIKFFGNHEVHTKNQLIEKITELIGNQKIEMILMQYIDKFLEFSTQSFKVIIPRTLIQEEMKTRMGSLEGRMGGKAELQKYFESIGEEGKNEMLGDISNAAELSLHKFFLLKHLAVDEMKLEQIDWKTPMSVELKVYEYLNSDVQKNSAIQNLKNKIENINLNSKGSAKNIPPNEIRSDSDSSDRSVNSEEQNFDNTENQDSNLPSDIRKEGQSIDINPTSISTDTLKSSLFNFEEYIEELRDFELEPVMSFEKLSGKIEGTIEAQIWYKEYLSLFETIPYQVTDGYENSFDWSMLLRLLASSGNINCKLLVSKGDERTVECHVKDIVQNIDDNISQLDASSILRLFEDTVKENISLQYKLKNGNDQIGANRLNKIVDWAQKLKIIKSRLNPPQKRIEEATSNSLNNVITGDFKPNSYEEIPTEFSIPDNLNVPQELISSENRLVYLIINSKNMEKFNRQQSTIDRLHQMSKKEKSKLIAILIGEIQRS